LYWWNSGQKVNKTKGSECSAALKQESKSFESRPSSVHVESSANFGMRSLTFTTNSQCTPWVIFNYGGRICIKRSIRGSRVVYNPLLDCSRLDNGEIIQSDPPSEDLLQTFNETVERMEPSKISHWPDFLFYRCITHSRYIF
jgi:hypothetical protein